MKQLWAKTIRYQATVQIGRKFYNVLCESDFDDGFAVYVNKEFVTDVETLPTYEELVEIIRDNNEIEGDIKTGLANSGVFNEE